jgi:hypothetical protein
MPFPTNTIKYGLYLPKTILYEEKENYRLSISISHSILLALKDNIVDDETIITLSFYLQMGLINSAIQLHPSLLTALKMEKYVQNIRTDTDLIKLKFNESRTILMEIAEDIRLLKNTPPWFNEWMTDCTFEFEKCKKDNVTEIMAYKKIEKLIHKHLAITPQMRLMLNYFIEHILFAQNTN